MGDSTAIVVREQPIVSVYDPRDLVEARALAVEFAASRLFSAKGKEQALAVMGAGAELGLSPLASLRMIYVAEFQRGQPQISISADAMVAACLRRRDVCSYFRTVESTDTACTVETQRAGDPPRRVTFTMEDAKRAKLGRAGEDKDATSSNWAKYPAVMLRHRAASMLAREVFPDILGGMYTADELQEAARDERDVTPVVQPLPAAAPPARAAAGIVEAEVVDDDARAAGIVKRLEAARTEVERAAAVKDANALPRGPARDRCAAAAAAAKKRIAEAATQAVVDVAAATTGGCDGVHAAPACAAGADCWLADREA